MFVGRKKDLEILNSKFVSNGFESILLSGRRRIGKTSLIKKAINDFDCIKIYFLVSEDSLQSNIDKLLSIVSKEFNLPYQFSGNLIDIIKYIFTQSLNQKIIFVIDEYQYLKKVLPNIDSEMQGLIDDFEKRSLLKLIISGSYINTLEDLVKHNRPLYKRFTYQMVLGDLNYLESSEFYPNYSLEDKVKTYAIFGGSPFYNSFLKPNLSIDENILNILENPFILDSPISIYSQEIKNISGANSVISKIIKGKHKFSDLTSDIITSSNLSYLLDPLLKMGLLKKELPINDSNNHKKTFYYIEDNFLDFYYRYIFTNNSDFSIMDKKEYFETFIKENLNKQFIPKKFEKIAKQAIIIRNLKRMFNKSFTNIGKYWYDDTKTKTNVEFDLVALDIEKTYTFFEVKYTKEPINDSMVNQKIYQLNNLGISNFNLGFVSKSGFAITENKNYLMFDLKDLYFEK